MSSSIRIEQVTSSTKDEYIEISNQAMHEEDSRWFMESGWYYPAEITNGWNDERYLIKNKDKIIGFYSISKTHNHHRASIDSMYLIPEYRGSGVLIYAITAIIKRFFGELGYNRLETSAWENNTKIVQLYDRLMKREGISKGYFYYNRKYFNCISWGLTYNDTGLNGKTDITIRDVKKILKKNWENK